MAKNDWGDELASPDEAAPAAEDPRAWGDKPAAQRDLPAGVKPATDASRRNFAEHDPRRVDLPQPEPLGDPMGTGGSEIMAAAQPERESVLEGTTLPEPTVTPAQEAENARLSRRDYAQRTPAVDAPPQTVAKPGERQKPNRAEDLGRQAGDTGFVGRSVAKAAAGAAEGLLGAARAGAEAVGVDKVAEIARQGANAAGDFQSGMGKPQPFLGFNPSGPMPYLQDQAEGAASSLLQSAGFASTFGARAVIPMLSVQSAGQKYQQAREAGMSPGMALANAVPTGAFEAIGEKFQGLDKAAAALKVLMTRGAPKAAVQEAGQALVHAGIREVPGEVITYLGQSGIDLLPGIGLNPNMSVGDFLDGLRDTVVQAGMMGLAEGGGGVAAGGHVRPARPDLTPEQLARSKGFLVQQQRIDQLNAAGEKQVAETLQRRLSAAQAEGEIEDMADRQFAQDPDFQQRYRAMRAEGMKPAEASSRAAMLSGFAQLGPQAGMTPKAVQSAIEAASKLPLDKVPAFLERYTASLSKAGMGQALPAGTVSGAVGAVGEDAMNTAVDNIARILGADKPKGEGATAAPAATESAAAAPAVSQEAASVSEEPESVTPAADFDAGNDIRVTPEAEAAHAAATSPLNDRPEPTPAQKEAGNYALGHIKVGGLDISVENPQGSVRRGVDADGKPWETPMRDHYGYIKGTVGADKDHLDVFVKPGTPADFKGPVFVVDQVDPSTGRFDEAKVVIGAADQGEAEQVYRRNYSADWQGLGAITQLPMNAFKAWATSKKTKEPLGDLSHISTAAPGAKPAAADAAETQGEPAGAQQPEGAGKAVEAAAADVAGTSFRQRVEASAKERGYIVAKGERSFAGGEAGSRVIVLEDQPEADFMKKHGNSSDDVLAHEFAHAYWAGATALPNFRDPRNTPLRKQLQAVSRAFRPYVWEHHQEHAKKPDELLADGLAFWIKHPERRAEFPLVDKLMRDYDAGDLVRNFPDVGSAEKVTKAAAAPANSSQTSTAPSEKATPRSGETAPAAPSWAMKTDGTLSIKGDPDALRAQLKAIPDRSIMRMKNGLVVGKSQVRKALAILEGKPAPKREAGPLSVGTTPGDAEPVTVRDGVVHIGKYEALDFDSGEPVKVPAGADEATIRKALTDTGALSTRHRFFGGQQHQQQEEAPAAAEKRERFDFTAGGPMTTDQVKAAVQQITGTWPNGPVVHVVLSERQLPGQNSPGLRGLYTRDTGLWIVASRNRSRVQLARTLAHEAVAHYGLRNMLGRERWNRAMDNIQAGIERGDAVLAKLREEVRAVYRNEQGENYLAPRAEADEIAAAAVEQAVGPDGEFRPGFGWVKSIYAAVAEFLRGLGINVRFTHVELQGMLVLAQQHLKAGRRTAGGGEMVLAAARGEDETAQARAPARTDAEKAAILQGQPVADLPTPQAPRGFAQLRKWATKLFADAGGQAVNPELGAIVLNHHSVRDSLAHGMNQYKAEAFAAVPAVIEKGVLVHRAPGENFESFYVSAPVRIQGKDDVVTVLVRRDANTQRMYLHSVATKESLLGPGVSWTTGKDPQRPRSSTSGDVASVLRHLLQFKLDGAQEGDTFDGSAQARAATGNETRDDAAPAAPRPLSRWRDATGRLQFAPGQVLYDLIGKAADPLLSALQLKAASPALRHALRSMKNDVRKAQETAAAVAGEANKLSAEERAMVSDIVEKEMAAGTVPPEHAVRLAALINDVMGKQTDELVRLGMLEEGSAEKWRGQYLPRYYESKLTKKAADAWADALRRITGRPRTMRGISGKHLKGRGLFETIPESALPDYEAMGWEVRDPDYKAGEPTQDGTVQVWRDFTREERDKMGEIRDAGFRFVMGYMQTQRDIALGRMFEQLAGDASISSRTATDQFTVRVPTSTVEGTGAKTYGKLAGRYVSKDTLSHLTAIEEAQSAAWQMYRKGMAVWKEGKTALNPVSHMNNVLSNLTMAHFAGVSYWDAHKYAAAVHDLARTSDMVKEARDAGLFGGTLSEAELMNLLPPQLRKLAATQESLTEKVGRTAFNILTFYLRRPMGWAYQAEDSFFRYLLYRDARQRGLEPNDAVDWAQRFIFTYDDLPKGARMIRDIGIPFFSYTYKAAPALLHTGLTHPLRFAAPAAVLWAANAAAYAIAAGDDDDDWEERLRKYLTDPAYRQKARELEQTEREHLPPWMKGTTSLLTPKTLRLGMDEVTKLPLFIDISRIIPGGDLFDVSPNAGGLPIPQPITPSHPLFTTAVAMFGNKDLYFGKEIVDSNDTRLEATQKRADWLWKQLSPAIAFGNYHWERGLNALAQATGHEVRWLPEEVAPGAEATGMGRDGLPVQPKYAALQTVGIKVRPIDIDTSMEIEESMRKKMVRDIETELRRLKRLYDKGAISDRAYEKAEDLARTKQERLKEGLTVDGDKP